MTHGNPLRSPSHRATCQAARRQVAVFTHPPRSIVHLHGVDRAAFLNNFCTNDIKNLNAGQIVEAFVTTHQARVLAWIQVAVLPDRLLVTAEADLGPKLATHLERYHITEAVEITDVSGTWGTRYVVGPAAAGVLGSALERGALDLHADQAEATGPEALPVVVLRLDWFGVPGYFVHAPPVVLAELDVRLQALGAIFGERTSWDDLRVGHAIPAYGQDIDETNLPQEVNRTSRAISFTKGCYLGQEPVARLHALGHVNRLLVPLRILTEGTDPSGLVGAKLLVGNQDAGRVMSCGVDPDGEQWLALAYVRREFQQAATKFELHSTRGEVLRAEFRSIPEVNFPAHA